MPWLCDEELDGSWGEIEVGGGGFFFVCRKDNEYGSPDAVQQSAAQLSTAQHSTADNEARWMLSVFGTRANE